MKKFIDTGQQQFTFSGKLHTSNAAGHSTAARNTNSAAVGKAALELSC